MAITAVQNKAQYAGAASSVIVHLTSSTTATDTLIGLFCLPTGQSVVSVNDSTSNRWIQAAYSTTTAGNVECWMARGIQGGNASVTAVFSAASVGCNISEWSGMAYQSILDQWSQNTATSASVVPQTLTPRTTGELVITACNGGASVSAPVGYTALSILGNNEYAAGYQILSGSVATTTLFNQASSAVWACIEMSFLPANSTTVGAGTGPVGVNPLMQFPETLIQISEAQNYLSNFQGVGIWTDVTGYVEAFSITGPGRQHELDRVQATSGQFTVNNRDGTFNPWNTQSFLYPGGLDPQSPIKTTAAWNGITSPVAFLYIQSFTPGIQDALQVDLVINACDAFQALSLGYLASNNYQQAVLSGQ